MSAGHTQSNVSASELIATFTDYDHRESPYIGPALRIKICADLAFVYFGRLTEERASETFECDDLTGSIGVDAQALYETLGTMLRADDRQTMERLREGTLPADHPSLTAVPATGLLPGVRRRA